MVVPALALLLCLSAQLYLIFFKSFNWDEFLHYAFFFQLKSGTLVLPFQVLHLRMLWWAPEVSSDLLAQMTAARLFAWGAHLFTLLMIYGVARQFTSGKNAFFGAFAYLGAGYVFLHSFSIRSDPFVAATLMAALFLMAKGKLGLAKALAVGVLIGIAGMMTFKAVLYAPCFAGLAWLKLRERGETPQTIARFGVIALAAIVTFGSIYFFYAPYDEGPNVPAQRTSEISFYLRWFTFNLPFANFIGREIILAPLFFIMVVLSPRAWKAAGLDHNSKIALAGFLAPLAAIFLYRNTFPYFFVYILAPVAVGISPALGLVRDRYGNAFLSILLAAMPLTLAVLEPRDVIVRQRALIDYVHREFPDKTGYLDYSGMISDYPRVLKFLTSGNGLRLYREAGDPIIGREIDRGNLPFIIANHEVIAAVLEGRPYPNTFLPADLAAMNGNYVRQWGVLWREGIEVPAGSAAFEFDLRRSGPFTLAGDRLVVDGTAVSHGATVNLAKGRHLVTGQRARTITLWRGDRLPTPPPDLSMDQVFTNF